MRKLFLLILLILCSSGLMAMKRRVTSGITTVLRHPPHRLSTFHSKILIHSSTLFNQKKNYHQERYGVCNEAVSDRNQYYFINKNHINIFNPESVLKALTLIRNNKELTRFFINCDHTPFIALFYTEIQNEAHIHTIYRPDIGVGELPLFSKFLQKRSSDGNPLSRIELHCQWGKNRQFHAEFKDFLKKSRDHGVLCTDLFINSTTLFPKNHQQFILNAIKQTPPSQNIRVMVEAPHANDFNNKVFNINRTKYENPLKGKK